jgi:hypothetical protein
MFCEEFIREVNRARIERTTELEGWRCERELAKLLAAIKAGCPVRRSEGSSASTPREGGYFLNELGPKWPPAGLWIGIR